MSSASEPQRILIIGGPGNGKSTLARKITSATGLPLVHLDAHYWRPGWDAMPDDEWFPTVAELISADRWVMDGNFGSTLPARLARADLAVVLDLPRRVTMWRIAKRVVRYYGRTRPDLGQDCPERVDLTFLKWAWTFRAKQLPLLDAAVSGAGPDVGVVWLRSSREVSRWLARTAP